MWLLCWQFNVWKYCNIYYSNQFYMINNSITSSLKWFQMHIFRRWLVLMMKASFYWTGRSNRKEPSDSELVANGFIIRAREWFTDVLNSSDSFFICFSAQYSSSFPVCINLTVVNVSSLQKNNMDSHSGGPEGPGVGYHFNEFSSLCLKSTRRTNPSALCC